MRAACLGMLVLVGVVAAGCGGSQSTVAPVSPRTPSPSAFVQRSATQAAGSGVIAAAKTGVSLRPVPGTTFGLMIVVKNDTHRQLFLENVRAVVPHGSFVHQLGTHIAPFFQCKPYCPRHMVMKGPFGIQRPRTFQVHPLRSAQAQLNFAYAGCGALKTASTEPITQAVLLYRDAAGRTFRQTMALQSARLGLQRAGPIACSA